jgi:endonuclease/exonuclease/phosphatase family metal-dependent hydrolase
VALTVVSWNLQGSAAPDLDAVAARLRDLGADVVALQEVQRAQLRELGRLGGFAHGRWSFKHWPLRAPSEGLGLLSQGAITRCTVQRLARPARFWSWRRRIAQHAEVAAGGAHLALVNVHLAAGVDDAGAAGERIDQADRLLARRDPRAVVAGDLNDTPGSAVLDRFAAAGLRDVWEQAHADRPHPPTNWRAGPRAAPPVDRLDYVLVPNAVEVLDAHVPADWERYAPLSDHLPVVAALRPAREDPSRQR